jgi:hypothetical protein
MKLFFGVLATLLTSAAASSGVESAGHLRNLAIDTSHMDQSVLQMTSLDEYEGDKCTTIVVGPKAGIEGPMASHTADCADCDFRIGKVCTCFLGFLLCVPSQFVFEKCI